jgi:biotin operon repressor
MTSNQLISRFRTNLRLFLTLAAMTLIAGVASFFLIAVIVGFASRSVWLGVGAAFSAAAIDCIASFLLVLAVAQNPRAFAGAQRAADKIASYFQAEAATEADGEGTDEDEDRDYDEEEEEDYDEEQEGAGAAQEGVEEAVLAELKEHDGLLLDEIAANTGFDAEDVKASLTQLQERGLVVSSLTDKGYQWRVSPEESTDK